jgi:hypothetical protein
MDWINRNSLLLTEAIRQSILAAILFGLVAWTDQQVAGFLMAVSAIMALFTSKTNISAENVDRIVERRMVDVMTTPPAGVTRAEMAANVREERGD